MEKYNLLIISVVAVVAIVSLAVIVGTTANSVNTGYALRVAGADLQEASKIQPAKEITYSYQGITVYDDGSYAAPKAKSSGGYYVCADTNADGKNDIVDIVNLVNFIFKNGTAPANGAGDVNGDCNINVLDITYYVDWKYKSQPAPICNPDCETSCFDSDPANDPFVFGYINLTNSSGTSFWPDVCTGSTQIGVVQYQCEDYGYSSQFYNCPNGCEQGECIAGNQSVCGNGIIETGEQCDNGAANGVPCNPPYGGSCQYCSSACTNVALTGHYCGDGVCDSGYENSSTCPGDCGSLGPDLIVLDSYFVDSNQSPNNDSLQIVIKNIGDVPVSNSFYVDSIFNNSNGTVHYSNHYIYVSGAIYPGQTRTIYHYLGANIPTGTYLHRVWVDRTYAVAESNEGNNVKLKTIYVGG